MNSRIFHKRAFYLAVIANHVSDPSNGLDVDVYYESKRGDPRLTTLILRPRHGTSSIISDYFVDHADSFSDNALTDVSKLNAVVRIIPTLSISSPIPQTKLSPTRSNFRVHPSDSTDFSHENVPTPLYNAVLMLTFSPRPHVLSVNTLKDDVPAYRDAFSLLRVWANQRGYGEGQRTCIRGFESAGPWWSAVLELLIRGEGPSGRSKAKRRPLGNGLSSYQLFKAALDFLCMFSLRQSEC